MLTLTSPTGHHARSSTALITHPTTREHSSKVVGTIGSQVVGVLLAAGAGSRYGCPKALAHDGAWLVGAITALLDGGCDEVFVVLGAADLSQVSLKQGVAARLEEPRVSVIHNPRWPEGMSSSLRAGLEASARTSAELAVIHLVDTPDVGTDVIARVVDAVRDAGWSRGQRLRGRGDNSQPNLRSGLARAYFGTVPGHPVAIGRQFWGDILVSTAGDAGARELLRSHVDALNVQCSDLATGRDHDVVERPASEE